ncbi:MAG: methyltransferase domain-containing protein [Bacteroidales bacterium]
MHSYQYSSDWIKRYENIHRWAFYWHQIDLVSSVLKEGERILEIGVGTKFTSNYLKSKGFHVTTMDIDPDKKPDIVANIVDYEFRETYDHVLAFEVFEHIPFADFEKALGKISRICRKYLLMSVPRNEKSWLRIDVELPGRKNLGFGITTRRRKIISRYHHWEVDFPPWTRHKLEQCFADNGFSVELRRKVSYIYFYSLAKRK